MKVSRFVFNMFGINTYVMWDPESREAAIVDPGMIDEREREALDSFIERNNLKVTQLINTHAHLDHIFGNAYIKDKYGLKIQGEPSDTFLAENLPEQAARFGLRMPLQPSGIEVALHNGDSFRLGDEKVEVIGVPGHSPGSIALYCPLSGFVITGDALFQGSIGRTDLPGGNGHVLVHSILSGLMSLPSDTAVYPGHGPSTTIARERATNPFLR